MTTQNATDDDLSGRSTYICWYCTYPCFPGESTVLTEDGRRVEMASLQAGDRVLTLDVATGKTYFDEVITFLHRTENGTGPYTYLRLTLDNGKSISLTEKHLIYSLTSVEDEEQRRQTVDYTFGEPKFAGRVKPSDYLFQIDRATGGFTKQKVVAVTREHRDAGLFGPLTTSGNIVVDDVLASCYAQYEMHDMAHVAMSPLRAANAMTKFLNAARWGWASSYLWPTTATNYIDGIHPYAVFLLNSPLMGLLP